VISLRHHAVSAASVLFALAVGVTLGAGPLRGPVDTTSADRSVSDQRAVTALERQVSDLRAALDFDDGFAAAVAPGLVTGSLRGREVTVLALPTASPADVSALEGLVGTAGGSVGGTLRLSDKLVDPGDKQLVDELGRQMVGRRGSGVVVPAGAGPYERMGVLLARAVGTRSRGGATVDAAASTIVDELSVAGLMSGGGSLNRRGDLALLVAGAGTGSSEQRRGAGTIVTALVQAVDAGTGGTVVAGPPAAASGDGPVKAVRVDARAARAVSTVDALGRPAGPVLTVLALAGQAAGAVGHYGSVHAADGLLPAPRPR
jgi:Copper transport outer membrane protein, MctB